MFILQHFDDGKGQKGLSREEVCIGLVGWERAVCEDMSGVTTVGAAMMELAGGFLAELSSVPVSTALLGGGSGVVIVGIPVVVVVVVVAAVGG